MAGYSPYLQVVVTVFMILFGVNFSAYFLILRRKFRQAFSMEEVRWYLLIIAASILSIALMILDLYPSFGEALRHSAFQVGSIITTTGYSTTDFNLWPAIPRTILVMLMFIGACAGSTGGGIKVSRILILCKAIRKELHLILHPRSVKKLKMDGHALDTEVIRSTSAFFVAYILFFSFSVLLVGVDDLDLVTNFTGVAATLNNIGPGPGAGGTHGEFLRIFGFLYRDPHSGYAGREAGDFPAASFVYQGYLEAEIKQGAVPKPHTHKEVMVSCRAAWQIAMLSCFFFLVQWSACPRPVSVPRRSSR